MSFKKINNEEEKNLVLDRLKSIFNLEHGQINYKEAEKLMDLIDKYDTLESSRNSISDTSESYNN